MQTKSLEAGMEATLELLDMFNPVSLGSCKHEWINSLEVGCTFRSFEWIILKVITLTRQGDIWIFILIQTLIKVSWN